MLTYLNPIYAVFIKGKVINEKREPVYNCLIKVENGQYSALSDSAGGFVLFCKNSRKAIISTSHLAYFPACDTLYLPNKEHQVEVEIQLSDRDYHLNCVTVFAKRNRDVLEISQYTAPVPEIRTIDNQASVIQPDIFRFLQFLPGVNAASDFSAGLFVRGGSDDQNLINFDGVRIINPSHFGGLFTSFIAEGVGDYKFYKTAYPVCYDGAVSSVVNVTTKEIPAQNENYVSLSLLSAEAVSAFPWKDGGCIVGIRRSHLDPLMQAYKLPDYNFYDFFSKVEQNISSSDYLSVSTLASTDKLNITDKDAIIDINWHNFAASVNHRHNFNADFNVNSTLSFTEFSNEQIFRNKEDLDNINLSDLKLDDLQGDNKIGAFALKTAFDYQVDNTSRINCGVELEKSYYSFCEEYFQNQDYNKEHDDNYLKIGSWTEWSEKAGAWVLTGGLRLNFNPDLGENYKYGFSPRITLERSIGANGLLQLFGGRSQQEIFAVQLGDFPVKIINPWFHIDKSMKPCLTDYAGAGYRHNLLIAEQSMVVSVEGYYRNLQNVYRLGYDDTHFDVESDQDLADIFDRYNGYAYGTEAMLSKQNGKLNFNISYSLAVAKLQQKEKYRTRYDYFNSTLAFENRWFAPYWDSRHTIKGQLNYHFNKNLSFGLAVNYSSGKPYQKKYFYPYDTNEDGEINLTQINGNRDSGRYPDYFRTDLAVNYLWVWPNSNLMLNLSVINVSNYANSLMYYGDDPDHGLITHKEVSMFPLLPSLRAVYQF